MKYFKHMAIMSDDTKIKRLKRKYGLQGYGLYVLILEYIAKQLDKHSPLPDLQEKAEDISDEWGCDIREVNEMMLMMINEGLFEVNYITGQLVCTKIEKYLDEYIRKIPEIGEAIEQFKTEQNRQLYIEQENSDGIRQTPTNSDKLPLEQTRREEKRRDGEAVDNTQVDSLITYLNELTGKKYRKTESNRDKVRARLNEGYTEDDVRRVFRVKTDEWLGTDMERYLHFDTLCRPSKFEKYLNQPEPLQEQENDVKLAEMIGPEEE